MKNYKIKIDLIYLDNLLEEAQSTYKEDKIRYIVMEDKKFKN